MAPPPWNPEASLVSPSRSPRCALAIRQWHQRRCKGAPWRLLEYYLLFSSLIAPLPQTSHNLDGLNPPPPVLRLKTPRGEEAVELDLDPPPVEPTLSEEQCMFSTHCYPSQNGSSTCRPFLRPSSLEARGT
ncbi:hypothetical protein Bca101_099500 [Brassica carinata]